MKIDAKSEKRYLRKENHKRSIQITPKWNEAIRAEKK
jgi:hypothetical protein